MKQRYLWCNLKLRLKYGKCSLPLKFETTSNLTSIKFTDIHVSNDNIIQWIIFNGNHLSNRLYVQVRVFTIVPYFLKLPELINSIENWFIYKQEFTALRMKLILQKLLLIIPSIHKNMDSINSQTFYICYLY